MRHERMVVFVIAMLASALTCAEGQAAQDDTRSAVTNPRSSDPGNYPSKQPGEYQAVPQVLTLPAGTIITVRTTQPLSSDRNQPGDSFSAVLDQSVIAQGWVIARRGQTVMGRVVTSQKSSRSGGSSQLAIELSELSLVDGQPLPIRTELAAISNDNRARGRNEGAVVGATTGTGAVIGAIAGGGPGAAIGAAVGAAAGVAGVLSTRGRPTEIYSEAQLTFRLESPATISTERSSHAFLPVGPNDYNRGPSTNSNRYPEVRNYPPAPRPYFVPYDYYWYGLPYSYFGLYGYIGPRFYGGSRAYIRPGNRWYRR
jgi:hypothetical protein